MISSRLARSNNVDTDVWIITFADLLTLLIAFFVLRYTMYTELTEVPLSETKTFATVNKPEESQLFNEIRDFLKQTLTYRESTKNTASGIQTTVVFDGMASLSVISGGAQLSLNADAIANSPQDLSLTSREILELLGKALGKGGDLIVIRYQTANNTADGSLIDSGWNTSSVKAAVIYRQLIDAGVKKERIFVEAFPSTKPSIKGDISITAVRHDEILAKTLIRDEVLLNLTTAKPASESKITFLDL